MFGFIKRMLSVPEVDNRKWLIMYDSPNSSKVFKLLPSPCDTETANAVVAGARAKEPRINHWLEEVKSE